MNDLKNIIHFSYPSSISEIVAMNDSFDSCVLRICYSGENRNKSSISKDVIEAALPSMPYCPIVTNYDIETDEIGSHDMAVVPQEDGTFKMVNLTDAVGVIPADPECYWETIEDGDTTHEYLCAKALIWKRSAAYEKLKEDMVVNQSMEIEITSGFKNKEGIYEITGFNFQAFALISATPCFEGASATFSMVDINESMKNMLDDYKKEFSLIIDPPADEAEGDNTKHPQDFSREGGDEVLDNVLETVEVSEQEAVEEVNETPEGNFDLADTEEAVEEPAVEEAPEESHEEPETAEFELATITAENIRESLAAIRYETPWHELDCRFWFEDYDPQAGLVYAIDKANGYTLCAIPFSMDNDKVVLNVDEIKRVKRAYTDYVEGSVDSLSNSLAAFSLSYSDCANQLNDLKREVEELRAFKQSVEDENLKNAQSELFARFSDIADTEEFRLLTEDPNKYDLATLEEKCYAIRGRMTPAAKFSLETKAPKLVVEEITEPNEKEPYGGLFKRYGTNK